MRRCAGATPSRPSPAPCSTRRGTYRCAGCGQDAFSSAAKFDGGDGWPSFWPSFYGAVAEVEGRSAPVFRASLRCSRCGGHLGALSTDAPTPTGLRYRALGAALGFSPDQAPRAKPPAA